MTALEQQKLDTITEAAELLLEALRDSIEYEHGYVSMSYNEVQEKNTLAIANAVRLGLGAKKAGL